jgi:regulator of cell morphogenesis and NO signaling
MIENRFQAGITIIAICIRRSFHHDKGTHYSKSKKAFFILQHIIFQILTNIIMRLTALIYSVSLLLYICSIRILHMETSTRKNMNELSARELCLYISAKHHKYQQTMISSIKVHLHASEKIDAAKFPSVKTSGEIFSSIQEQLTNHLHKEEQMLFPFAEELKANKKSLVASLMEKPIKKLKKEHETILATFDRLRKTNAEYHLGAGWSPTGKLAMLEMEELEIDVKKCIALEENILFPLLLTMAHDLNAARAKQ